MSIKHRWAIAALATLVLVPAASPAGEPLVTLGAIASSRPEFARLSKA